MLASQTLNPSYTMSPNKAIDQLGQGQKQVRSEVYCQAQQSFQLRPQWGNLALFSYFVFQTSTKFVRSLVS